MKIIVRTVSARNVVILLGGPGAGKGTQADPISEWLGIPHISTGQLLRAEIGAASELGLRAKALVEAGNLVSDEIVNELVAQRISREDCTGGFLLDGYPRDVGQAVTLQRNLTANDRLFVVDIEVETEKVTARLTGRRTCKYCGAIYHMVASPPKRAGICNACGGVLMQRSDDREEVIRERFKIYRDITKPLTEFYRQAGVYHRIDGMQVPDQVARDIRQVLEKEIVPASPGKMPATAARRLTDV